MANEHLLSGLHFVHTSSVAFPAAGLLPASNHFVSQNTRAGRLVRFSTLYALTKTLHLTSMEWITIETFHSTLLISLYSNLPTLHFFYPVLALRHLLWWIASLAGPLSLHANIILVVISPFSPVPT